jgi:Flp pilus assembly protein TadD
MKKTIFLLVIVLGFSCPSIQAEMSMRIISRNIRSHEEKAVADNEEKREAAKAVEVEGTKEAEEVTASTTAVEAAETSEVTDAAYVDAVAGTAEIKEVPGAVDVAKTTEAVGAIEATEVKEPTEVTEATKAVEATETSEVTEAADVEAVAGTMEVTEASDVIEAANVEEVKEMVEMTEATTAAEVTDVSEATDAEETKEAIEMTEVITAVEVTEISETTEATETTTPVEVTEVIVSTETIEAGPVDYEALGLRSVELNPNDYPDEVIALLEPHKNNENNNSVLFYSSLGLAYKSKGRLKAAIAAYKRALKLVPSVPAPSIQYNLGIAYYYNDELHKSFNCFLNSSAQRSDHLGTEKWIKQLADELDIYKVPNTSKLKLVVNQKISVNRKKDDRESRIRMYLTQDGGRIQELSVKDEIYAYGIDSDAERPVDYIIIDNDGDGFFDNVINTKGKFGVPTWAYNPD